ncbi:MAG: aminotransferase class IV, partial [Pseudomonadota bacterium]|nr:aminotransferase class IV [Pseudomonadota bacterium]
MIPFDKRQGEIWLDGDFVPWAEARLHVLSHGLHYGGSAFEGERAYNGRIFKLEEHSARLVDSARILDMDMKWTADEISAASAETIVRNGLNEAYIRPVIWRGAEGLGIGADGLTTHLAIAAWRWNDAFPPKAYTHGIRLATASWRRPNPMTAPTKAKAGGLYSIGTLAKHEAIRKGAQDAL